MTDRHEILAIDALENGYYYVEGNAIHYGWFCFEVPELSEVMANLRSLGFSFIFTLPH